ncbi:glycoside hydrolase family 75 protein [Streptomyces sp. Je 1-369]|uniref:glycoside hydrolase family 75 protein n=1 Tax=Streptomyces sp. Je 1-369 TaxID=2966192 RepID=UPI0022856A69|nr:glycoside hydrolase family 75 protein [Streptomyces sp. Je 1-369]WAL93864.1 glycoside hydrolase family 75 protein [Streptomyces sp. Je 1-369]
MRKKTPVLVAAAGAALLVPAWYTVMARESPAEPIADPPPAAAGPVAEAFRERTVRERTAREGAAREGTVRAADLLAATRSCTPVSNDMYSTDDGALADVPVCATRGAVFWKADMDVDCDGRPGKTCNDRTDPLFQPTTAFQQSDGRELDAESLPYVVVPGASHRWDHTEHGITGGTVAAVVHRDKVQYAVVGDTGPTDLIGEASYATARGLGINPDPGIGGAGADVTYILFEGSKAEPIESHGAAVARGEELARQLVRGN